MKFEIGQYNKKWNQTLKKTLKTQHFQSKEIVLKKVAMKGVVGKKISYEEFLKQVNIPTLKERRTVLSANFANKCIKKKQEKNMFPKVTENDTKKTDKFQKQNMQD